MATFAYSGRTRAGQNVAGERIADSMDGAVAALRREQILVTQISPVKEKAKAGPKRQKGVAAKNLAVFTRQFSVMIDAGLPLVQCLDILAQQQENKFFQQTLSQVRQDVEEGATLAAAMSRHPKVFDELFTNMIDAGETGGILDLILQRLSTFIEKIVKLRRDVVSALIYPVAVILIAVLVISAIMVFVIPQFQSIFMNMLGKEEKLPLPTQIVIDVSDFIAGWGGLTVLVGVVIVAVAVRAYYKTPGGRYAIDGLLLKTPIIGQVLRKIAIARFTRTLSTLLSSGVPILQSLEITAKTAGNVRVEEAVMKVRSGVERGESFVDPLKATDMFPNMVAQMIGIGEQTGQLDTMLSKIADFYEQ
jgi:type IV pilus assembly protein PilC